MGCEYAGWAAEMTSETSGLLRFVRLTLGVERSPSRAGWLLLTHTYTPQRVTSEFWLPPSLSRSEFRATAEAHVQAHVGCCTRCWTPR